MAEANRHGTPPLRRREDSLPHSPNAGRRGPVPTRRNVEDTGDPYLPNHTHPGKAVCRECQAVFHDDRWSLDPAAREKALRGGGVQYVTCPACQKIRDRVPGGLFTLSGDFVAEHREEILNLIRNEDMRARNVNPLERVMEISEEGSEMVVTTTNEKLAQRLGRAVHRAYGGHVEYQWLADAKQARVRWSR
ncbi:MAG: BCAM0308 family protein [Armatimonadota bacterium]|nr:BCAM0308 family protein [Armatimonadota bacterium]